MRAEFGDDIEAAWSYTEPQQLDGIREWAPFVNAFMVASSTISITPQGDLLDFLGDNAPTVENMPRAGRQRGLTSVPNLASPETAESSAMGAGLEEQWSAIYAEWRDNLSPLDYEIWSLRNSPFFEDHGYRGIEDALTADARTGQSPLKKSSIQRHVKAMEASLGALAQSHFGAAAG
jgi:hypothetical protein